MPENTPNYGIQQSGGVSNVGNQAVGPHARAVSHGLHFTAGPDLAQLMALLEQHRAEVPGAAAVAEELQDELDSPEPDRGAIGRTLDRLTQLVRPVAPLAETVGEISKAVDSAFGS